MRKVLTKKDIDALIESMPHKKPTWIENENERKETYRQILAVQAHGAAAHAGLAGEGIHLCFRSDGRFYFASVTHHDVDDLLIGLAHADAGEPANIVDGVFHTLDHDAVAAVELLSLHLHMHTQKTRFHG